MLLKRDMQLSQQTLDINHLISVMLAGQKTILRGQEIYAHENLPLTYNFGQHLVNVIYSEKATFSYFSGCSNGGRMGAIAAQRYPELFDGIISGCPIVNLSMNGGVFGAWVLQSMTRKDGSLK